jgi:hypothetical protein
MLNEGKTVSIKYRLRQDRVIRSGFEDDDAVVVIPAGTAFELPAGFAPPQDADFVRRHVRERAEGERATV